MSKMKAKGKEIKLGWLLKRDKEMQERSYKEGYEQGKKDVLKMAKNKQKAYIKNGMINGSCGLAWLIEELSVRA